MNETNKLIENLVNKNNEQLLINTYIPGSASSCAYQVIENNIVNLPIIGDIYKNRVIKQKNTIKEQFLQGIRAFEIQVIKENNKYYIVTEDYDYLTPSIVKHMLLDNFINIIDELIKENPEEAIIIVFNELYINDMRNIFVYLYNNFLKMSTIAPTYKIKNEVLIKKPGLKLEKNTLYLLGIKYLPISTDDIDRQIEEYAKNPMYFKYVSVRPAQYYHIMYSMYFFLSIFISTMIMLLFFKIYMMSNSNLSMSNISMSNISTLNPSKLNLSELNLNEIIFYIFFITLYIFITLLIYFNIMPNDNINQEIIKCLDRLNNSEINFTNKIILYEMCNQELNLSIYSRNM